MTDPCEHGLLVDEHCRVCDEHDECQPPPSFGYRDRTDGDEILLGGQPTEPSPWRFLFGLGVVVVAIIWWVCR
jgi:hypothetical protein